ncbi:MAG: penicillin-binding protein 2 [Magnetococcales bacterium]|nr:penicillin-binding protein 2 [Magnetococcales bacterium]
MLEDDQERFKDEARRRLIIMGGASGFLFSLLGGRLFHLQVLKGAAYRDMAEENRISMHPIPPHRGRMLDRFGAVLVENLPDYRLAIIPELSGGLSTQLERLKPYLDLSDAEIKAALDRARRQRSFLPFKVKDHLTWEQIARIEARIHKFPGAVIEALPLRTYPFESTAAHILGYLGENTKRDRKRFRYLRYRSGDLVGKTGIERSFEPRLRGREGVREMEVNARGRQVRELHSSEPLPGLDLHLTLDVDLQHQAELALGNQAGAVTAIDVRSGEILAMASRPGYDPNQFIRGFSTKQWQALLADRDRPLTNKAIQGQYPPASTFKIIVALAALEAGVIDPEERLFCGGHLERYESKFYCWNSYGHGRLNFQQAMAKSCDVYYYRVAERLGIDAIEKQARRLGLGELTGVPLGGEKKGLIPSRAWKMSTLKRAWFPGETLISAIGQGFVLSTPLQLANMMATVANGGVLYRPTLVREENPSQPRIKRRIDFNETHLATVKRSLEAVMQRGGTGYKARPHMVRVAGKTGTSQVVRQRRTKEGRAIQDSGGNQRLQDHALFVCYAPAIQPELAVSVVIEHGGGGGAVAAPVAQRVIDHYFSCPIRPERSGGRA